MPRSKRDTTEVTIRPVTQRDIAARLGLHQTAVSFALRGDPSVSPETRARVVAMAQELGYDPERHHAARMLQQRRFDTPLRHGVIALLRSMPMQRSPYHLDVFLGIEHATFQKGCDLILCSFTVGGTTDDTIASSLKRGYVDGILFASPAEAIAPHMAAMAAIPALHGRPIVTFYQSIPTCSSVTVDEAHGSYLATKHLLSIGHRSILVQKPLNTESLWQKRWAGITLACAEVGVAVERTIALLELGWGWLDPDFPVEQLALLTPLGSTADTTTLPVYLRRHSEITAVLAWNDACAIHAWQQLDQAGFRIPEDISLIGFDDAQAFPSTLDNRLTTVRQPFERIGEEAVSLLLSHIRGEVTPPRHEILPCEFILRDSTAPPRKP